jgi:hypothetical protein
MGSDQHQAAMRDFAPDEHSARLPWPPAARALLWMDAVLLVVAALAVGGMPPALGHGASAWTWIALGGSTLTAVLAALSAFELSAPGRRQAWALLPVPAFLLWIGASGLGCLAPPSGAEVWGDEVSEAGKCLGFLLAISLPLLALILFMLWTAPLMTARTLALGAIASAGAAASLLALVHPHDAALLDLGAHAVAIAIVLGITAAAARIRPRT